MGVEPTAARAVRPAADFEDREAHRDSYTPATTIAQAGVYRHNQKYKNGTQINVDKR